MRLGHQIIDLETEKIYSTEMQASKDCNISRYYIRKSLKEKNMIMGKMFAYYSYSMNIKDVKSIYENNYERLHYNKNAKRIDIIKEILK